MMCITFAHAYACAAYAARVSRIAACTAETIRSLAGNTRGLFIEVFRDRHSALRYHRDRLHFSGRKVVRSYRRKSGYR